MNQNRFKSPVLWTAIAALIFFITKNWIGFDIPGWDTFVNLVITVLVAFGVINNPTNKDSL